MFEIRARELRATFLRNYSVRNYSVRNRSVRNYSVRNRSVRRHTGPQAEDNSSPQDAQAAAPSLDLTIAAGTTYR